MALDIEAIQERKVALEGDVEKLRETISQIDITKQPTGGHGIDLTKLLRARRLMMFTLHT